MKRLFSKKRGQSLVEYMLILAFIGLGVSTALTQMGDETSQAFSLSGNAMDSAVENSKDELIAMENEENISSYRSGTLQGVQTGITPPPTSGGTTGSGGYKSPTSPTTNQLPVANFKWEPSVPQPNEPVKFLNTSTDPDGDRIVNEQWENKLDKYPPGKHIVKLRVADEKGNWSNWIEQEVTVQNLPPDIPTITMNPKENLFIDTVISFEASSKDPNNDTVYIEWNNKKATYPLGLNTVKARAKDEWGLYSDWATISFEIKNSVPTNPTSFTCTPTGLKYVETIVKCSASGSVDKEGDAIIYEYLNISSNDKYPVGVTTVKARAVDVNENASDWVDYNIIIENRPPTKPSINVKLLEKTPYYSIIEIEGYGSTDPDGDSITYVYEGKSSDNKYLNGSYSIKVWARDNHGALSEMVLYEFETTSPLKTMFETWENYKRGSDLGSGMWSYDPNNDWIYSTRNVGWTGYWNPSDTVLENYRLTFDMAQTPRDGDDDNIGMTFRMKDINNMYFFTMDNRLSNGGAIHSGLYKIQNGSQVRLVDLMPLKWDSNVWYNVRIETVNNNIKIWLDGNLIVDYTDTNNPILNGGYGPFTYSQANGAYKGLVLDILE